MLGLTAKMPKNLFSFLRLCVLLLGFAIICSGAVCISAGSSACKCNKVPIAYFLLPLGFLLLISGIFWSTYHEASKHKSLFHRIIQQNPRFRDSHITTIDRPDFYPPTYEDSTDPEKQTFPLPVCLLEEERESYNIPPPLYTESSLDFIEEASSQEQQPPSYEVSVQQQPAAECDSALQETSNAPASQP
ncbi:transmembrane protein 252 [Eublepharis macularius]|uniref:Transmembrane protein 252 n=1 Tax=Eublepharis macularius TaxID=481883 RepID=A0AA97JTZ1_EUBMA|nr:transmembrane protein 252 [Eublepharis macularius]